MGNFHSVPVEGNPVQNDLGLTIVVDPGAKRNIDLVFIHGLGGMSQTAWSDDGKPEHFWPKEWLPQEKGMETAKIMMWGYYAPSNPFSKGTTMTILRFASDLLNALLVNNAGRMHPIVFVCHSMGGLIAKQAIISGSADPQFRQIINNVKGVIFFGTPHHGTNLASMATFIDQVVCAPQFRKGHQYIGELKSDADRIEDINNNFRHQLSRLFVLSFYEECPSFRFGDVVIVPRASAILNSAREISCGIHADHSSICKYSSSVCPQYRVAADNISRFIQIINLFSSPNFSPEALDSLALFLYGDERGVVQARESVSGRARGMVGSKIGWDHELLEQLAELKAKVLWHCQLVEGLKSLNLPAPGGNNFMSAFLEHSRMMARQIHLTIYQLLLNIEGGFIQSYMGLISE